MRKLKLNGHDVEIYDGAIEELPAVRFHKYNKMLLIDAGIGSDLTDVDGHLEKAIIYSRSKSPELGGIELENLRQNIYLIQSEISPKNMAFAVLVKSINGIERNDFSETGLKEVLSFFNETPQNEITAQLEAVKKKIDEELQLYFPKQFDDPLVKEYYDLLKERNILMFKAVINGNSEENTKMVEDINNRLMVYNKPNVFTGVENAEIAHDKNFENICILISKNLNVDAKKQTVLEFYNSFEYVKEMLKPKNN